MLVEEDLDSKELWSANDIKISVYNNTEDGAFHRFLLIYAD